MNLSRTSKAIFASSLGLCASAFAAVEGEPGFGLPRDISVDGHRIDSLMNWTHIFNIILFVIMCVWMVYAAVKHNRSHTTDYDHGDSKRSTVVALSLSAFIFFVVDGNLFVQTMIGLSEAFWNFEIPQKDPNTVRLEINAHQWAWDARYAGTDGKFNTPDDVVTWNDVKIPAGTPVTIQLTSTDVIHSFWVPNFRVKMDAVPGQVNRFWFRSKPEARGDYDIACTQHCGTHHYKMKGMISVLDPAEYKRWLAEASLNGERSYDPADKDAHWGWEWKEKEQEKQEVAANQ
jgi:cytochrome c oxidase subunit II